jgi:hypothetical protein
MANTPMKPVRMPDELWADAGQTAQRAGTDRSEVIRSFLEWYVRRPGAKMPKRPAAD